MTSDLRVNWDRDKTITKDVALIRLSLNINRWRNGILNNDIMQVGNLLKKRQSKTCAIDVVGVSITVGLLKWI